MLNLLINIKKDKTGYGEHLYLPDLLLMCDLLIIVGDDMILVSDQSFSLEDPHIFLVCNVQKLPDVIHIGLSHGLTILLSHQVCYIIQILLLLLMWFSVYSTICRPFRDAFRFFFVLYQLVSLASTSSRVRATVFYSA